MITSLHLPTRPSRGAGSCFGRTAAAFRPGRDPDHPVLELRSLRPQFMLGASLRHRNEQILRRIDGVLGFADDMFKSQKSGFDPAYPPTGLPRFGPGCPGKVKCRGGMALGGGKLLSGHGDPILKQSFILRRRGRRRSRNFGNSRRRLWLRGRDRRLISPAVFLRQKIGVSQIVVPVFFSSRGCQRGLRHGAALRMMILRRPAAKYLVQSYHGPAFWCPLTHCSAALSRNKMNIRFIKDGTLT